MESLNPKLSSFFFTFGSITILWPINSQMRKSIMTRESLFKMDPPWNEGGSPNVFSMGFHMKDLPMNIVPYQGGNGS